MADSLLHKISVNKNFLQVTDQWSNDALGAIVDIRGNHEYRFIDYIVSENTIRNKYRTDDEKLQCPIVACGIVGYWLKYKDSQNIKTIFNNYYDLCEKQYEANHENEPDAWERNLQYEFASKHHIREEKHLIKQSEAIYPFLTESDCKTIHHITSNYLKFSRTRRKDATPTHIPPEKIIEETFFAAYSLGGGAYECIDWFRHKYDMHIMGPHNFSDRNTTRKLDGRWETWYNEELPENIIEEYEDFDDSVLVYKNGGMMEEIQNNLEKCSSRDDRFRYIASLLQPFRDFAEAFCPIGSIHERENSIEHIRTDLAYWQTVPEDTVDPDSGEPVNPKAQIEACRSIIDTYQKDIQYWKELERKFYDFAQRGLNQEFQDGDNPEMCKCLGAWWSLMLTFSMKLAALALTYGIKLMDVQEHCEIYLKWHFDLTDYVDDKNISTYEQAKQLLENIESTKNPQKESDYSKILNIIYNGYTAIEKLPPDERTSGEVPLRNQIVSTLQTHGYHATAESLNRSGKTDICIKGNNNANVFIAECKIWHGERQLHNAIDQLFSYLTWRDKQTALIIFVENDNFTKILESAYTSITKHKLFQKDAVSNSAQDNRKSYIFRHSNDSAVNIELELMLFHLPKPSKGNATSCSIIRDATE